MPTDLPTSTDVSRRWRGGLWRCLALALLMVIGTIANAVLEACAAAADRLSR